MLSRPAPRKRYQHRAPPRHAPPTRRTGRKFIQPAPRPELPPAIKRQDLLDSRFGQLLSMLLHVVALTSFSIIGGYAWGFFLMTGFKLGMLMGMMTYGVILLVSAMLETEAQKKLEHAAIEDS